jgi:hypothetical protein
MTRFANKMPNSYYLFKYKIITPNVPTERAHFFTFTTHKMFLWNIKRSCKKFKVFNLKKMYN